MRQGEGGNLLSYWLGRNRAKINNTHNTQPRVSRGFNQNLVKFLRAWYLVPFSNTRRLELICPGVTHYIHTHTYIYFLIYIYILGKDIILRFIGMLYKTVSSRKKCKTFHQGISHTHYLLQDYIASARGTSQKGTLFPASEAYNWWWGPFLKLPWEVPMPS